MEIARLLVELIVRQMLALEKMRQDRANSGPESPKTLKVEK
jgi:hypothetical protein